MRGWMTEEAAQGDARDRALLGRVAAGDVAAFRALHARYRRPVLGFARRMVRSDDAAEQVAGDTMLAVWRGADRFEGRSKVSTWVFGIAFRTATKAVRGAGRHPSHAGLDDAVEVPDAGVPSAEMRLDALRLREAMDRLPPEMRAVMILTYLYGHSVGEVAAIAGVPPGTIKSRMHAARARLKEALE